MPWQAQTLVLSAGALAAGLALTWGEYRGPRALVYAAKPLATLLILALAALAPPGADPWVARWIVAGLVFSLAGDVLLMLPSDRFAAGLASFLVAHLCYIAAFTHEAGFQLAPLVLAPLLVAVWLVYRRLAPGLGEPAHPGDRLHRRDRRDGVAGARALRAWCPAPGRRSRPPARCSSPPRIRRSRWRASRGRSGAHKPSCMRSYFAAQWLIARLAVRSARLTGSGDDLPPRRPARVPASLRGRAERTARRRRGSLEPAPAGRLRRRHLSRGTRIRSRSCGSRPIRAGCCCRRSCASRAGWPARCAGASFEVTLDTRLRPRDPRLRFGAPRRRAREPGSRRRCWRPTRSSSSWASRTAPRPGRRASWWAASTASRSAAPSSASRCSRCARTLPRSPW